MKPRIIAVLLAVSACLLAGTRGPRADAPAPAPAPAAKPAAPDAEPMLQDLPDPIKKLDEVPNLFAPTSTPGPDDAVTAFSIEVLETYVTFFPGRSTRIGVRTLDQDLGDYRKASVDAFIGSNKGYLLALEKIPTAGLTDKGRLELESLRVHLRSLIQLTDALGAPQHDPNFYVDESIGAVAESIDHDESKPAEKAAHLFARLTIIPKFLDLAKQNLTTCPRPAVRRAIIRLRSADPMFVTQIPAGFHESGSPIQAKQGQGATAVAWKAISSFADWLEKEKLPSAAAAAPVGEAGWHAWILAREDVDLDPARALAAAEADLSKLEGELRGEAAHAASDKTAATVVGEIASERLEPYLARAQAEGKVIPRLWEWMIHERPVSPPSAQVIEVRETPAYRRRESPLRADFPGGYAKEDATSYLEIAAPDPDWPQARMLSWLSGYGKNFIKGALAREVYPGRFVAWQRSRTAKTRANRTLDFPMMNGGWALYAEELALRRGFATEEPKTRIAMLVDLIRADLRLIASVRIHTKQMPRDAVSDLLRTRGYWSRPEADEEAERILGDLDAAAPALGRLAIAALRDDAKKAGGASFVERDFHDRLLSYGSAPITVLRRAILPEGGDGLLPPLKPRAVPAAPVPPAASLSTRPVPHAS
jgi:hypothetical protein